MSLSYAESDSEGAESVDDDLFKPSTRSKPERSSKRKVAESPDEDAYEDREIDDANEDGTQSQNSSSRIQMLTDLFRRPG